MGEQCHSRYIGNSLVVGYRDANLNPILSLLVVLIKMITKNGKVSLGYRAEADSGS